MNRNASFRLCCLKAFIPFMVFSLSLGLTPSFARDLDQETLKIWLDESLANRKIPGFSAVITKGDKVIFEYSFGKTSNEGTAITLEHVFHQASIAKAFVGAAIMQLVEEQKIELDDQVTKYLPYFEISGSGSEKITIRQLLAHQAGIPDVEDYAWAAPSMGDDALESWVKTFPDRTLLFEPGADARYSNIGFEVLGDVIAKVTGLSFESAMEDLVLHPLGMSESTFFFPDVPHQLRTKGHFLSEGEGENEFVVREFDFYPFNRRHGPSSTLNSNAKDMAKWLIFFATEGKGFSGDFLTPESIQAMWAPHFQINENAARALGWGVGMVDEVRVAGHAGGDDGFHSNMRILPDQQIGLAFMANTSWAPSALPLFKAMQDAALGKELPPVLGAPTSAEFEE